MARMNFTQLWKTRRRECILAGGVLLLLLLLSLLINLGSITRKTSRAMAGTADSRRELENKQAELLEAIRVERELAAPVRELAFRRQSFWQASGNLQADFRRKVEQAAKESNLRLKSLGTIQTMKVAEGLNSYEITLAADAQVKEVIDFMARVEQERPAVFWKNITVTPDNMKSPNFLMLNATLKIVALNSPDAEQRIWGEK